MHPAPATGAESRAGGAVRCENLHERSLTFIAAGAAEAIEIWLRLAKTSNEETVSKLL
jgi:hypothetical protein